jgi:serine/threonine-protein kinase
MQGEGHGGESDMTEPESLVGQQLGQYELVALLGKGGMAHVYRARQRSMSREVAVKVITPTQSERSEFVARFDREARIIASMSHPHIGKVFDFGEHEDAVYLVMELLTGGSLTDLMKASRLSHDRILKLAHSIASALDYAHRRGIIHRDLKPQNVLLDEDGNAYITDFGLAKSSLNATSLTNTRAGVLLGTPAYMSPEQWRGEAVDKRTDVYAMGVMLFEMLANQRPFVGDSIHALLQGHLYEPPPAVHEINPALSPSVSRVLQQAMAKAPNERYGGASELVQALEESLTGEMTDTRNRADIITLRAERDESTLIHDSLLTTPALPAPARRRLMAMGAGIVALLVLAVLMASALNPTSGGTSATPPSNVLPANVVATVAPVGANEHMVLICQLQRSPTVTRNAAGMLVDDLRQTLESVPFATVRSREFASVCETSEAARAAAFANGAAVVVWGVDDGKELDLNVQVGTTEGFTYTQFPEALIRRIADVRVTVTDTSRQSIAPQVASVMIALHTADGDGYEVVRNLALIEQVADLSPEIFGRNPAALMHRAENIYLTDTEGFLKRVTEVISLDESNPMLYCYRALAYQRLGMVEASRRDFETARRLGNALGLTAWATPVYGLGINALYANDVSLAKRYFEEVVVARPKDWVAQAFRGLISYFEGDFATAKTYLDQSIALEPTASYSYLAAVLVALRQGRIKDAQRYSNIVATKFPTPTLANRILGAAYGDMNAATGLYVGTFISGGTYFLLSRYEQAVTDIDAALQANVKFREADLHLVRGVALCNQGLYKEAEDAYTAAIALDPDYGLLYLLRAEVRRYQGNALGLALDAPQALRLSQTDEYSVLARAGVDGSVTCKNFFTFTLGE